MVNLPSTISAAVDLSFTIGRLYFHVAFCDRRAVPCGGALIGGFTIAFTAASDGYDRREYQRSATVATIRGHNPFL